MTSDLDRDSNPDSDKEQQDRFAGRLEARKKAMDYLARREYARDELTTKLVNAGFDQQTAADAVAQLSREGLQNDRRYVESFIQSRINQGKGPVRIRAELGQRGVAAPLVDELLDDRDEDWPALARNVRLRKFGADVPRDFRDKARQLRFLQYRGFDQAHIQAAFRSEQDDR